MELENNLKLNVIVVENMKNGFFKSEIGLNGFP
jgi:hypothetical protein